MQPLRLVIPIKHQHKFKYLEVSIINVSNLESHMKSILLVIFSLIFASKIFAADVANQVSGKWVCEPFEDIISEEVIFVVDLSINYKSDKTFVQTETWKLKGQESNIWFTLDLIGTWQLEGNTLTEKLIEERPIAISDYEKMPDMQVMKGFVNSLNLKTKTTTSIVLESTETQLITKQTKNNKITSCSIG